MHSEMVVIIPQNTHTVYGAKIISYAVGIGGFFKLAVKRKRYESSRLELISSDCAQGPIFLLLKLNNNDTNPILIICIF